MTLPGGCPADIQESHTSMSHLLCQEMTDTCDPSTSHLSSHDIQNMLCQHFPSIVCWLSAYFRCVGIGTGMGNPHGFAVRVPLGMDMDTATQYLCPYPGPEAQAWVIRGGYPQTLARIPPLCMSTTKIILASLHITPSYQHDPRQIEHMIYITCRVNTTKVEKLKVRIRAP